MHIEEIITKAINQNASDIHLATGTTPILRINGDLHKLFYPALTANEINHFLQPILTIEQQQKLAHDLDLDFIYQTIEGHRLRSNVFYQQHGMSLALRIISKKIPTLTQINAPKICHQLCELKHGLILITGPTGSGKSTTLAAITNHINFHQSKHIITLEDPIEFIHMSEKCLINQREIQHHFLNYPNGLRAALREDPDIILLGEMRDLETIRLALTAAETGHLVLATLHTDSAAKAINRIIDVFPAGEKEIIRTLLADSLQAVIAQYLIKDARLGRIAIFETLLATSAIRHLIRENKIAHIISAMQTGQAEGMCTFEQYLLQLNNPQASFQSFASA